MLSLKILFSQKFEAKVYKIFNSYYKKILLILTKSGIIISDNILADTLVLCYLFANTSIIPFHASKKETAGKIIENYVFEISKMNNILSLFQERYEFYGSIIIGGTAVRADYWIGDPPEALLEDPSSRCILAYGDMLHNPDFFHDYENTPVLLCGIDENVSFLKTTIFPIQHKLMELQNALSSLQH